MKKKYDTIKCPYCDYENVKHAKKCKKCNGLLDSTVKTCPKCAKRNSVDTKKCINCGFKFNKKDISLWVNLGITLILIVSSIILILLNQEAIVNEINSGMKVIAFLLIVYIFFNTLTYGKKDIAPLPGDESVEYRKHYKFIRIRTIILFVITILVIAAIIYTLYRRG